MLSQKISGVNSLPFPKEDFPIFSHHPSLIFFDNAATTQKPKQVLKALQGYYENYTANIHRGLYHIAEEASYRYTQAHRQIAQFIGAKEEEVIFVRNTTEGINLFLRTWGDQHIQEGDLLVASIMDHHALLVPLWQLAKRKNAQVILCPINTDGLLDEEAFEKILLREPKLVALTHISNVLGTVWPVKAYANQAKEVGATVIVDAAQSAPHLPLSVRDLGVDALAFSSHKMLGPTGIGALWVRKELLETLPPFLGGGDMIEKVEWNKHNGSIHPIWNRLPWKFEAGTQPIGEAIGFAEGVNYLRSHHLEKLRKHEKALLQILDEGFKEMPKIKLLIPNTKAERIGVVAFTVEGYTPEEVALYLDQHNLACRAGLHCAHPLHQFLGIPGSIRLSLYGYNSHEEVMRCLEVLKAL